MWSVFCRSRYILCRSCCRRGPESSCSCHWWNCADICQQRYWWGLIHTIMHHYSLDTFLAIIDVFSFALLTLISCWLLIFLKVLGTCEIFEEKQVGNERFNIFSGCPSGLTATIVLRGGADQVWKLCINAVNGDASFFFFFLNINILMLNNGFWSDY